MSADQANHTVLVPEPNFKTPPEVLGSAASLEEELRLRGRRRPFVCPTDLHDWCSSSADHAPKVEDGLSG